MLPQHFIEDAVRNIGKGTLEAWEYNVADELREAYEEGYRDGVEDGKCQKEE